MRRFSSYGPISKNLNFYVPRTDLLQAARRSLIGDDPAEGGHYITVWASRQTGKSWLLRELAWDLATDSRWYVAKLDLEILKTTDSPVEAAQYIIRDLNRVARLSLPIPGSLVDFEACFSSIYLDRPLILILDEFDALGAEIIAALVSSFRNIYLKRTGQAGPSAEKYYLLHGLALIGVRSVVGIENRTGSPFNVQRSLHIPNLTEAEVNEMFRWYERDAGQKVEQAVIDKVWYVTQGQPGLVSWFGELLTEQFNPGIGHPLDMAAWELTYSSALHTLPNNSIINLVSKARQEPYRSTVLDLFRTDTKQPFEFEDPNLNYLYMNGVITWERVDGRSMTRFPCQFVQEKLFRAFAREFYGGLDPRLSDPFIDLTPVIDPQRIDVPKLLEIYQEYFIANREYIISCAPRRADNRIFEATYHFHFYSWLESFLRNRKGLVLPEFPTGNGKIDLLLRYATERYGIELKSFVDFSTLQESIGQAGRYARSLGLERITLAVFIERPLPEDKRPKFAQPFQVEGGSEIQVIFLVVG